VSRYWLWLHDNLKLTRLGQVLVSALLLIGMIAAATGTGFAFYNVESGHDPDVALGFQIAFSWVVVAVLDAVLIGIVLTLDTAFRRARSRFANLS
jgi:hypothetical protein